MNNKTTIYDRILKFYHTTNNIKETILKFKRNINIVYSILETQNININDNIIMDIFIDVNIRGNKEFPCILKSRINFFKENKLNNKFILDVVNYLKNRYDDSLSLSETIARIFNKMENRPVCKECGKPLKYIALNHPFNLFCSKSCSNNNEDTKNHLKETCLKKYGVTNTAKAECVKRKYRDRMEEKYGKGIINAFQVKSVIKKLEQTKIKKYGDKNYNNRIGAEKTCLKKYGVSSTSQILDIRHKQQFRYKYKGISFDSKPEIAFYIWLTDIKDILDIDFEYSPSKKFEYIFNDKKYFYIPDFRIENQYFELKGNHFFKNGKMINPFRYKHWTDDEYKLICDKYEAKHQCMLKNNIQILTNNNYNFFIDYVKKEYGNHYLDQFKNNYVKPNTKIPEKFFGLTQNDILNICLCNNFPGTKKYEPNHPIWDCNVAGKLSPKQAWKSEKYLKQAINNLFYILNKSINIGPTFYPEFAKSIENAFMRGELDICRIILHRFTVAKIAPKVTALQPHIFEKIIDESGVDISCGVYCPMAGFGGIIEGTKRWFKKHNKECNIEAYDINENFCNYFGWGKRNVLSQVVETDKVLVACPPFGLNTERWEGTPIEMYYDFNEWCELLKKHIKAKNYIFIGPEINNNVQFKTGVERPIIFRKKIGIQLYKEFLNKGN